MKSLLVAIAAGVTGTMAMTFTWEGASTFTIAFTGLVTALFVGGLSIMNSVQARTERRALAAQIKADTDQAKAEAKAQAVELAHKTDTLMEKTVEIHTATNGTLSALTKSLEVANTKIAGLETLIASMVAAAKSQTAAVSEAGKLTPPTTYHDIVER